MLLINEGEEGSNLLLLYSWNTGIACAGNFCLNRETSQRDEIFIENDYSCKYSTPVGVEQPPNRHFL